MSWVDLSGQPAAPPDLASLPSPEDVLSGQAVPNFGGLRLRSQDSFICGNLHRYAHVWDQYMFSTDGYEVVRPWLINKVDIPAFFQHYRGTFNGRQFAGITSILLTGPSRSVWGKVV